MGTLEGPRLASAQTEPPKKRESKGKETVEFDFDAQAPFGLVSEEEYDPFAAAPAEANSRQEAGRQKAEQKLKDYFEAPSSGGVIEFDFSDGSVIAKESAPTHQQPKIARKGDARNVPPAGLRTVNRLLDSEEPESKTELKEIVWDRAKEFGLDDQLAASLKGRFFLQKYLAEGGMGMVFEAFDLGLRQPVVVKFLIPEQHGGRVKKQFLDRFQFEAQALARLQSPHVVTVLDADWNGEGAWMAMRKVEGEGLDKRISYGMPVTDAVDAGLQIAQGVRDIHEVGLVHRDLKPGNIMFDAKRGVYQVIDFGLSQDMTRQRDRYRWLEQNMRAVLSGERTLESLKLSEASLRRLKKALAVIKDKQLKEEFIAGKLVLEDLDEHFQEQFAGIAQHFELKDSEDSELLLFSVQYEQRRAMATEIFTMMRGQRPDSRLSRPLLVKMKDLVTQLETDSYAQTLLRERQDNELVDYLAQQPVLVELAEDSTVQGLSMTEVGLTLGTPLYMSPEQVRGAQVDEKSDVWALGCIFHEMLSGSTPFPGRERIVLFKNIMQSDPAPLGGDVPKDLEALILTMLSKDPKDRPDVAKVVETLEQVKKQLTPSLVRRLAGRMKKIVA